MPFKPTQGRPVLCRQCFKNKRAPTAQLLPRSPAAATADTVAEIRLGPLHAPRAAPVASGQCRSGTAAGETPQLDRSAALVGRMSITCQQVTAASRLLRGRQLPTLVRARATLGDFELTVCTDGTYLLDGGAMFGVVPKTLWQKRIAADPDNRILLGLNTVDRAHRQTHRRHRDRHRQQAAAQDAGDLPEPGAAAAVA